MRPGKNSAEEIINSVKKGIYVKEYTGGNVDIVKGDFTFDCSDRQRLAHISERAICRCIKTKFIKFFV
jgi:hypothetical protein